MKLESCFASRLQKLTAEGNTRARALLGLAVVEWSASQFETALELLRKTLLCSTRLQIKRLKVLITVNSPLFFDT